MSDETTIESTIATLYARVSVELHRRARMQAFTEGRPVAELVADAVERYLEAEASA